MSTTQRLLPIVAVTGTSLLVGCGGGGAYCGGSYGSFGSYGSYGSCGSTGAVDFSGIYEGNLTDPADQQQNPVVAIIADDGEARMSGQDGTYYRLNVGTYGSELSGSFLGYSQTASFPDGTRDTSGTLTATLATPNMSGTLTFAAGQTEPMQLTFDNTYDSGSSLQTLAGTWTYSAGGFTLNATVQSDGSLTATDSNGCSYSGAFSIIDSHFDVYHASYTRTCSGGKATFTGLASYFPASGTPAHVELLADDGAGDFLAAALQP